MSFSNLFSGKDIEKEYYDSGELMLEYEVDKESGSLFVDRFMGTAMHYPCNYGYVPHTLSDDGDPVDVLVITPIPLMNSSVIRCRPIGVLKMTDESGEDAKVLAVPVSKLTTLYDDVQSYEDISNVFKRRGRSRFE